MKKEKLNNIIQRELSSILQNEVKDPHIGFCTITGVDVTNDYSYAKVYVTFLDPHYHKNMKALERSKGFIRSLLAKRLKIRKCPELTFVIDHSIEYGNKIEEIIDQINEKS